MDESGGREGECRIAAVDEQARWAKAVDKIGRYPSLLMHDDDGSFRLDRRPERNGRLPDWFVTTLQQSPPAWATAAIKGMHRLELLTEGAEARERDAAHHIEELQEMIAAAGPALQPASRSWSNRRQRDPQVGPALWPRDNGNGL